MKVKKFVAFEDQQCQMGDSHWYVTRLVQLSKDFEVMDIPLNHLNIWHQYEKLTLRELAGHVIAVNDADLSCPIILDEDGEIFDGRHRVMKAMIEGKETIKAVRFEENPPPCRVTNGSGEG